MAVFGFLGRVVRGVPREVIAMWLAARDPATPRPAKALALLAGLYALSPLDLVPDLLMGLGWLDDLVLVPAALWLAGRWVPAPVMDKARGRAEVLAAQPRRWLWRAALFVLVWLALLVAVAVWLLWR